MRKLGLIGGMSWVSTRTYYEHINRIVQQRCDRRTSAPLLIESLDFAQLYALHTEDDWSRAATILSASAQRLEAAGAEGLIIGANSMHRVYDTVASAVSIPILHIADCVGARMEADGVRTAALLGTRNVMVEGFYRRRLVARGVDLVPPDMSNVEQLDQIIYDELMVGRVTRSAERALKSMVTFIQQSGTEAVVLACTELEMVVDADANVLPIYDSARIHSEAAADWILAGGEQVDNIAA
ncbi:aspartate racemase [Croceibacterium mercuriale]|uniref:Aspartate racemase n=1 Tax=Croceibacterium mercuriale TaxID=1572751 RepID=A0A0B2C1F6_9SPHN|nr:amino acid racemase [Croceibacterium mercuriale]KHL26112.1 aspartate racemase [Croceibacterium mercuriale]